MVKHNFGYTFIEVLVVSAIALVITSVGLLRLSQSNKRQQALNEAAVLAQELMEIQKLAGKSHVNVCLTNATLKGYQVQAFQYNSEAQVNVICDNPLSYVNDVERIELTSGAIFDNGVDVEFTWPNGYANAETDIRIKKNNHVSCVNITTGGAIRAGLWVISPTAHCEIN